MTAALVERLRRADPSAYVHVDVVAVDAESSKRTQAQWAGATGAGFTTLATGGAQLTGSIAALVEHTTSTGYLTDIGGLAITPFDVVRIRWNGAESADTVLQRLKLYLHPRVDGGQPQAVVRWRVRCFAAVKVNAWWDYVGDVIASYDLELMPIGDYVDVTAGAAAGLVTFDFQDQGVFGRGLRPKNITCVLGQNNIPTAKFGITLEPIADYLSQAVTFVTIQALTATGATAGNVGLGYNSGQEVQDTSGNEIATRTLVLHLAVSGQGVMGAWLDQGDAGGAPRMAVETASFAAATATFEDAGNRLDLGAVPTGTVEFLARGEVPVGTSLAFEVRNDADSAWVAFADGDTTADLAGVGLAQTYKVRVTLTPDTAGDITPIARVIGVRERTTKALTNLTQIEGPRWAVDPITMKGEIGEARLTVVRDGVQDYYDAMTALLAAYDVGALTFEVFIADPTLDRADWLHVDTFVLDEPEYTSEAGITLILVTHLARLKQALPRPALLATTGASLTFAAASGTTGATITRAAPSFVTDGYLDGDVVTVAGSASNDGSYVVADVAASVLTLALGEVLAAEGPTSDPTLSAWVRRPYEQTNQTLEDVWADLADSQLAIPGRMRGPGVEDDTTQVAQTITDSEAKVELDAIAALAGGGNISSQGQIKFVSLLATTGLAATFPSEEITVLEMSPGLRHRVPESWIDYDWEPTEQRFRAQVRGVNTAALTGLGEAYIEPARMDEAISRWIVADSLAQTMADRDVRFRGTGIPRWRFRSTYCYPELEPGDLVAVETRQFVLRDPVTAASVRGRLWALGMLVAVDGCEGRDFTIWIRQFADFLPTCTTYDLDPTAPLVVEAYFTPVLGNPGQLTVRLAAPFGTTIQYAVQDWGSAVPDYGAAAYTTYTVPFQVTQLEDLDRQLVVYASRNGVFSLRREFRLDKNVDPSVSVTLSEPTAGTLRVSWVPDDDVVFVRVYVGADLAGNGYPTTGNTITGALDPAYLKATKYVRADGGEFDQNGDAIGPGGTQWEEAGYTAEAIKVIVVPFRSKEHVGDRATGSRTMGGGATAGLTAFTTAMTAAGTTCGAAAEITVSWTPNGTVADVTHDLKIYRRRDGGDWTLVKTEASPASTTTYVDEVEDYESTGSAIWYNWQYQYELVAGASVLDSGQADPVSIESSGTCPLS